LKGWIGKPDALTDLFLPVRINGDMALLQAISKCLLEMETKQPGKIVDQDFIKNKTTGFDDYLDHLQQLSLDTLSSACDIPLSSIQKAADIIGRKSRIIVCWAMGLTQHRNAVATIQEIVNLLLLKGSIGKKGAGTCPVRGHSNVQGDRTMGIYEKPSVSFLKALETNFHFSPPACPGYDVVEAIKAMHSRKAKVFFAMGGNFLSATPDTLFTAAALRNCKLTVHVSTKLNRSHLVHGEEALILPCLARTDRDELQGECQFISCENSMGVVQMSKGVLQPVSEHLLSEPAIVCLLAKATLRERSRINWDRYLQHYDHIRDDIAKTIPGFENYNTRVRHPGGFYLPNCTREGLFDTPGNKAKFTVSSFDTCELAAGELMMMTIRSHDQFNTTIYSLDDRYRGIYNERRVVLMNRYDIDRLGLQGNDNVDLYNETGAQTRIARKFVVVPYEIPAGCAATYFPEANVLVPIENVAAKSNTPVSKLVVIKLKKHDDFFNDKMGKPKS
jgi:molybdopterin-dependent oxidoreductase alpha subunit